MEQASSTVVTKEILKQGFSDLGIRAGMKLMVHASLKSFGYVEGGADTVIDALMELLTPEGTLMMPSFNHEAPYLQGEIFDISHTPTTNGLIPDTFWRRPGVSRSLNPTHPFAAWGKDRERYTRDHQKTSAMGHDSPLGRLMEDGGYCLLLGVGYGRNTFHHYVESCEGSPCLRLRGEVLLREPRVVRHLALHLELATTQLLAKPLQRVKGHEDLRGRPHDRRLGSHGRSLAVPHRRV